MDNRIIFIKTAKGEDEVRSKTGQLYGDIRRALLMVDGTATVGEISKRCAPSLRGVLDEMLKQLEKGGFIQDKAKPNNIPRMVVPPRMAAPLKQPAQEDIGELDFTAAFRAPSADMLAAEAEAKAGREIEAAKLKAQQEVDAARQKAEQEAARARAELEAVKAKAKQEAEAVRLKAEVEAKARAEARAKQEIEAARLKAQQEAEEARLRAEREAAKAREEAELAKQKALAEVRAREEAERRAREEAEAARVKAEQEAAQARAELKAARARAEAEAKARKEAERRAREEAETARLRAQQEAEAARLKAEREAAKAREEAELAKQKAAAEARARQEAERLAREEAEAVRMKAEQEAAQARAELEAARARAEAEAEAKAREEAERRAREEAETARLKAQQEAEAARVKAEREAAKAREEAELAKQKAAAEARARQEAERLAREEAEAVRMKAEQEAAQARADLEAERMRAEAEAETKAREEAERRAREEAETARLKAQQEAEAARLKEEREAAKEREEAGFAKPDTEAMPLKPEGAARPKAGAATMSRSTSVTVLFFDVVGYTKQSVNKQIQIKKRFNHLVTDCLNALEEGGHIILDTGDGAAIGFLQHPEDALEVAMQFRKTVMGKQHKDYPDLNVRIGIHLGPVNIVKDMNGQSNMVGDGINDAQRVMSFAGIDQIYISRPYYDFVSRLNDEYAGLFQYRGLQKDKHGREHPVYELMDAAAPVAQAELPQPREPAMAIKLEPFSFAMPEAAIPQPEPPVTVHEDLESQQVAAPIGFDQFNLPEETAEPVEAAPTVQEEQPPPAAAPPSSVTEAPPPEAAATPAAVAHMPSAEEVAKLAETQAKVWAEAGRRAAEAVSRPGAEQAAQPREKPSVEKAAPAVRARRKPLPWGKIGAGLFVALLVALFAVPPLLPMKGYATDIEKMLGERLKQPVHIGQLAARLLPTPRLELKDVSIGETKPAQARRAQLDFGLSAVFSSIKPVAGIELEGMQVNGAALQEVSAWLQTIAADARYPVARIALSQGKLEADGLQLSGIGGELSFDQAGKFTQAKLHAEGGKFALEMNAAPENKMQLAIMVRGSALPLLPNWVFDDLSAKGELAADGLLITEVDSRIMGGVLLGDARIDWRSGWRAQGNLTAKAITLQNVNKLLSGDMDGTARFQMQSANLSGLAETATLEGAFAVKKGVINGIDVVETARLRSRENLPGGRTHFDGLSGNLYYAGGDYHFRNLKMNAGVLNATGTLDITKQKVSGRAVADLTMRAGMGPVALQVDGTTDNPSLQAVR